MCQAYRQL